jgi:hypothetical protein
MVGRGNPHSRSSGETRLDAVSEWDADGGTEDRRGRLSGNPAPTTAITRQ